MLSPKGEGRGEGEGEVADSYASRPINQFFIWKSILAITLAKMFLKLLATYGFLAATLPSPQK